MRSVRLVTHCHAGLLPQYAIFLRYQLHSLATCRDGVQLSASVCYSSEDVRTIEALLWVRDRHPKFPLEMICLERGSLFRRSIGRNMAALSAYEDLVWFTDVDHVFLDGCFRGLFREWDVLDPKPAMIYPGTIQIHRTHELGDQLVAAYDYGDPSPLDASQFEDKHYSRAIGGVQIVTGSTARRYGYLGSSKRYQRPTDGEHPFPAFGDDRAYRTFCNAIGGVRKVQFDGVYRLRHSQTSYQ